MDQRVEVTEDEIAASLRLLEDCLRRRIAQKGRKSYIGIHEVDGILDEEVREFKDEVHADDKDAACDELMDVAVTCVFGRASMKANARYEAERRKAREEGR